jgi:hypothetical protein
MLERMQMADSPRILLEESNVISLRTAFVIDDGNVVCFRLMPAWLDSSVPSKPRDFEWTSQDYAYLYRRRLSPVQERELMQSLNRWLQQVRPLQFAILPEFGLVWSENGNSVALKLNGEPWAFIDEKTHKGYSKGIMTTDAAMNESRWDQQLFERLFGI